MRCIINKSFILEATKAVLPIERKTGPTETSELSKYQLFPVNTEKESQENVISISHFWRSNTSKNSQEKIKSVFVAK